MRVAFGCDHAGFSLREVVIKTIQKTGHEVIDFGIFTRERVDFPDYAEKVGRAIQEGRAARGILICGSGVGVCISANKMKNVYASICHDPYSAHQGVEHDNMNVLCLGGLIIGTELAAELVQIFLSSSYMDEGNYQRRFNKIKGLENSG
jgi:ribose 5-phosphate isomerase B